MNYLPERTKLSNDDLSIPRWKIDKQTGEFVNTMTGEVKQTVEAVILKIDKSRFLWQEPYGTSKMPLCFSPDAVTPTVSNPISPMCVGCPMSEWAFVNGKKVKPKCTLSYNYLLYDMETEIISVLNLTRSRTLTAKALNSFWRLSGVKFIIKLYTELVKDGLKEYFSVNFVVLSKLSDWTPFAILMLNYENLLLTGDINEEVEEEVETPVSSQIEF